MFQMGDYWYLVFSTFSDQFTTHYRIGKSPNGPWMIPEDDVFDTRSDYAIKTASDGKRRFAFGWIASKYGDRDFGPWEWGGTMVFHELIQNPNDGTLQVKVIHGVKEFYNEPQEATSLVSYNSETQNKENGICLKSETLGAGLYSVPEDCFSIEMDIHVKQAHEVGVALHVDAEMEKGYFLRMNQRKREVAWDMWPRSEQGVYQWDYKGEGGFLPTKNKSSVRKIQIDWQIVVKFSELTKNLPEGKPIFVGDKKIYNSTINDVLTRHCKACGISEISIHGLRHTHASLLLFAGVSIASVARRLGHASMTTTQKTYLHIIQELENKDVDLVMRTLSGL